MAGNDTFYFFDVVIANFDVFSVENTKKCMIFLGSFYLKDEESNDQLL